MTSNLGSPYILERAGSASWDEIERAVLEELRRHFRPEFMNRVDDVVVFRPLSREELRAIVELQLERVKHWLTDKRIFITFTTAAEDVIAREGYDPLFGARPLKRAIQRLVQNPLAMIVLIGEFEEGSMIEVDAAGDQLSFRKLTETAAVA
jgi:ATP-dependent Clp protease ATP-binding subunit ClpB